MRNLLGQCSNQALLAGQSKLRPVFEGNADHGLVFLKPGKRKKIVLRVITSSFSELALTGTAREPKQITLIPLFL